MREFAELLNRLYFTYSNNEKKILLKNYFATTTDPDRGYAVASIARMLTFKHFKRSLIQELILEQIDPVLFELSYDYVGDFSETVALLWPQKNISDTLPSLTEIVTALAHKDKAELKNYLIQLFNQNTAVQRWALIKLGIGGLRIGVSHRFLKQTLAEYGNKNVQEVEEVWHAIESPFLELFAWLENKEPKPDVMNSIYFHPVMLSNPLDETELSKISPEHFIAEWKYDGIRVQLVSTVAGKAIFSRTGDDISHSFPDIIENINFNAVLDGELVIYKNEQIATFNDLQQRLNRKTPSKKMLQEFPAHIIIYDLLMLNGIDYRPLPFTERREILEDWFNKMRPRNLSLSPFVHFSSPTILRSVRQRLMEYPSPSIEGLMLKRKTSSYLPGRPVGHWYKWKRDPFIIDAVLLYAQRGHGKRSSFYSDYTFGLWQNKKLLTIGKAYFGFTDEELKLLDKWVRHNTVNKFGPVREVAKKLVLEIAFDAIQKSARHKSGYALRFPRINRIRWDKPAEEADTLGALEKLFEKQN